MGLRTGTRITSYRLICLRIGGLTVKSFLETWGKVEKHPSPFFTEIKLQEGDIKHTGWDAGQEVWDKTSSQEAEVVCQEEQGWFRSS